MRECIKQKKTDSGRKLVATFRELLYHLDTSEILSNLSEYRGCNSETLGAKMKAIGRTELQKDFLW